MPEQNYIKDWLVEHERSIRWLAGKIGMKYTTLYRILNERDNKDLYNHFTLKQADELEKIIPDIKSQLRNTNLN